MSSSFINDAVRVLHTILGSIILAVASSARAGGHGMAAATRRIEARQESQAVRATLIYVLDSIEFET